MSIAAGLVLSFAAACASAETSDLATPVARDAPSQATSTPAAATTPSAPNPVRIFSVALRELYQEPTVTYTITSTVRLGDNAVRTEREVSVDADKEIALTRVRLVADVPGSEKTDLTMRIINTVDTAYLTMPAWTGSRRGKWMQFTPESAQSMGVPLQLSRPTTVPGGVEAFVPKRLSQSGSITGSVGALEAFHLLGLAGVLKDPDLASSLMGSVPASVTFDASGAIASFEVTGKGHDVVSTSDSLAPGMFDQLLSAASATVTIKQVGEPVDIEVPADEDVLPG